MNSTENQINIFCEKFKPYFKGSFLHSTLWELLINQEERANSGKCCFTYNYIGCKLSLVDEGQRGYNDTVCIFSSYNHEANKKVIDDLNQQVFGIDPMRAQQIVISTLKS